MDFSRLTNPDAYKQALAGLLRRGGEVTDYIATAPEKAGQTILEGHQRNKELQAQAFANPNRPFQVTNQQAMGELGDRMLAGPLSVAPVGMIAYHGTPHLIKDKFDISKVGTGEGAQAYGHGMYFAEAPDVARSYATDRSYVGKFMAGKPDTTPWEANRIAQDTLNVHGDNAIAQLEKTLKNNSFSKNPQQVQANKQVQDAIDLLKTNQLIPTGNLYKVDIPDEYLPKMLDYDKPLSKQPKVVQDAFKNIAAQDSDLPLDFLIKGDATGGSLMQAMDKVKASELLASQGVKGVRYLDEGSRGMRHKVQVYDKNNNLETENLFPTEQMAKDYIAQREKQGFKANLSAVDKKQTSNFVVFDPTDVKILERNNQPISRKELLQEQLDKIAK